MNRIRLASLALVAIWIAWWVASVGQNALVLGRFTWVPMLPLVAGDFQVHIDHVARRWASGLNPYEHPCDWVCSLFPYPPMILRLFAWVRLVSTPTAVAIWLLGIAACLAVGAVAAGRTRKALGLTPLPTVFLLAALLYSAPAVLAMDRGQCDPLLIPALAAAAAWLLKWKPKRGADTTLASELAAGGLLGLLAWLKYYPGLTLVGLLALRRWRSAAAFVVVASLIGAIDRVEVKRSIENGLTLMRTKTKAEAMYCHTSTHSLVAHWRAIRVVRQVRWLRRIPAPVASALLLAPAIGLVSLRVGRARDRGPWLVFPYGLWLSAAATFAMPYSVDYNLVPLPLAALAVWDRRDPLAVHVALAFSILTWGQPFALPLAGDTLLLLKLSALYAVGASLALKGTRQPTRIEFPHPPFLPSEANSGLRASAAGAWENR